MRKKEVLPAPVPVPGPDLTGNPSVVTVLGRDVQILTTMMSPRLVVFGGLLSDDECDEMIELAKPKLARSETVHTPSGGSEVHASRTSDGMFFERGENPLCQRIEAAHRGAAELAAAKRRRPADPALPPRRRVQGRTTTTSIRHNPARPPSCSAAASAWAR